jgi:hypothetical protein
LPPSVAASDLFMHLASRRPLGRSCWFHRRQEHSKKVDLTRFRGEARAWAQDMRSDGREHGGGLRCVWNDSGCAVSTLLVDR